MGQLGAAKDAKKDGDRSEDIDMSYWTVQPNRWTFRSDKIREWVEQHCQGRVLNACAGKTRLDHDGEVVRNDIDEQRDADLHVDVTEIADHFDRCSCRSYFRRGSVTKKHRLRYYFFRGHAPRGSAASVVSKQ